jgi:hypothetical protein
MDGVYIGETKYYYTLGNLKRRFLYIFYLKII